MNQLNLIDHRPNVKLPLFPAHEPCIPRLRHLDRVFVCATLPDRPKRTGSRRHPDLSGLGVGRLFWVQNRILRRQIDTQTISVQVPRQPVAIPPLVGLSDNIQREVLREIRALHKSSRAS